MQIFLHSVVQFNEEVKKVEVAFSLNETIAASDFLHAKVSMRQTDGIEFRESLWILEYVADEIAAYRSNIHFYDVIVEGGSLTIEDSRITSEQTAQFVVDPSLTDLVTDSEIRCHDGYVELSMSYTGRIIGDIIIT